MLDYGSIGRNKFEERAEIVSNEDKTMMTRSQTKSETKEQACYQCEGKGYTELRDCAGEIQRTETCSFCEGRGYVVQISSVNG